MKQLFAVLPAALAAACSYQGVGPGLRSGNPDFDVSESSYAEDGFQDRRDPLLFRVFLDAEGTLAPDPADHVIGDIRYAAAGRRLRACLGEDHDAEATASAFACRIGAASKTLVVLIHGCNNTYPEARRSYVLARMLMGRRDAAVLEVYWDGGTGDPLALWGHARESSRRAGAGLRGLLRRLDPEMNVRVITHSVGSAVIRAALWGSDGAAPPPLARYRLGLLVPAMGEEEFDACPRRALEDVVIGVNEHDPALLKGPFPSTWFGSTRLGCEPSVFPSHVAPAARDALLVDLSHSGVHDFKDYLLRRAFLERFLPRLLAGDGYQDSSTPAVSNAP